MADVSTLAALRLRIRHLDGGGAGFGAVRANLGHAQIDAHLPWGGLPRAALHEIRAPLRPGAPAGNPARCLGPSFQ